MEILCGENLSFKYLEGEKDAISKLNFTINKGEFVVIMGESGCGKSTLLKMIKSELLPAGQESGRLLYKGQEIEEVEERTKVSEIGFVMQNVDAQIVTDRVYHELAFVLESLSYKTEEIRLKVGEMASYFGIEDLFRKKTDELSGGEKQLVNLASVMVTGPELLLLDEPTSKLDHIAASEFISTLHKINVELGTTIVLVEHRLEEVFSIADRVMLMEEGKLLAFDKPRQVGKFLVNHKMIAGAPKAVVLYKEMPIPEENCPLNVKEGKEYIRDNFSNTKNIFEPEAFCIKNKLGQKKKSNIEIKNKEISVSNAKITKSTNNLSNKDKAYNKGNVSGEKILELKDIWFRYEKEESDVLRGVNLSVAKGEVFSLLGGNGAGKSTLFSVICGLQKPYRGKVLIDKLNIRKYKDKDFYGKKICMLPQEPINVFFKTQVYEDYIDVLDSSFSLKEKESKIKKVADTLKIEGLVKKHPYDLSGGELQKCAIGKLLLLEPEIILLDEPTKGIDGCGKEELVKIIHQLKEKKVTVVTVTHDVEFAADISDRCGMLFDGEILAVETPHNFFGKNNFYTTAVNRMSKDIYDNVIKLEELVWMIKENM